MPRIETRRAFYTALDPVHIGAGGHRLSRVDMTIVREPGTNLPKIPGTSLSGAARSYSALIYGRPEAAGQHLALDQEARKKPCPILYTFGTTLDTATGDADGTAGVISICDARILFFPVYSRFGPVWVTTAAILEEYGFALNPAPALAQPSKTATTLSSTKGQRMNLAALLLDKPKLVAVQNYPGSLEDSAPWKAISSRLVIVAEDLFPRIVNSNLEVRTSVSINPLTGAAQRGALFSYEAIPRATWLAGDVVQDDYHPEEKRKQWPYEKKFDGSTPLPKKWETPFDAAEAGLRLMRLLGVGGMGTRGFGRLDLAAMEPAA